MDAPPAIALVEAARRGDRAAAEALVTAFYERIFAFQRRLAGNDPDAADLTQRTFARVWQSLPTFAGRSTVSSWMHGIAYHVYVDWRRAERPGEPRSDAWWAARSADATGPDEVLCRADLSVALFTAVDRLDPGLRETVHLHYYQELTLQETAEALGIATSTVKYRLRQALTTLQNAMREEPHRTAQALSPEAT